MKKIIEFIIEQELESIDMYHSLVEPISWAFDLDISCAQSIIDTIVEWETDANTIDSLEDLLNKRFPDIVTI